MKSLALYQLRQQRLLEQQLGAELERLNTHGARNLLGHARPYLIDQHFDQNTPTVAGLYWLCTSHRSLLTLNEQEYLNNYITNHSQQIVQAVQQDLDALNTIRTNLVEQRAPQPQACEPMVAQATHQLEKELAFFESLLEYRASPTALRQLATKIDARVGIEFEMIHPDARDEDAVTEPDMSEDRPVQSIYDLIEFYDDGDFNSSRQLERLQAELEEAYAMWLWDQAAWRFDRGGYADAENLVQEKIINNNPIQPWIDEWIESHTTSESQPSELQDLADQAYEIFIQAEVDHEIRYEDDVYQEVREEWMEEWVSNAGDKQSEFLRDEHSVYDLGDAVNQFGLTWPYWEQEGSDSLSEIADSITDGIAEPVSLSHSRGYTQYVLTTDSSIDTEAGELGIELVSPPLTIDNLITDLGLVYAWAKDNNIRTNRSTGLHINVSVSGYNVDNLDYTKLALLVGDRYVLQQYQRLSNAFTSSAMGKIQNQIANLSPSDLETVLKTLKGGFDQTASALIHAPATNKYTSINIKSDRVEFRSPGGNWLDRTPESILNTVFRFVVALDAALDPEKYRKEYLKKLYATISKQADTAEQKDMMSLFVDYAAGMINRPDLVEFLRQRRKS